MEILSRKFWACQSLTLIRYQNYISWLLLMLRRSSTPSYPWIMELITTKAATPLSTILIKFCVSLWGLAMMPLLRVSQQGLAMTPHLRVSPWGSAMTLLLPVSPWGSVKILHLPGSLCGSVMTLHLSVSLWKSVLYFLSLWWTSILWWTLSLWWTPSLWWALNH